MQSEPLYYSDSYATETEAVIDEVEQRGGNTVAVQLDRTILYPEGGGQPCDQGTIATPTGSVKVQSVRSKDGAIWHEGPLSGVMEPGQQATVTLKWTRRFKNMRVHSAGHLIHDVLMTLTDGLVATKGHHGDKAFLEYQGELADGVAEKLADEVNATVVEDIPIRTWDSSYDEVVELCGAVPANLPRDKQLRMLQIGEFRPMPDGGVQVRSTREIGEIVIHHVTIEGGRTTIRYGVGRSLEGS